MSKKLMVQWLAEWLIKHGTEPIKVEKMGVFDITTFQKAMRLGYLQECPKKIESSFDYWDSLKPIRLTDKGIQYLKENDK